ncbi:MAG: NERD domain-containing protein [Nitrospirae bacterium]|nr:NERD domain-containing protein [Nitrospirota bacterium]
MATVLGESGRYVTEQSTKKFLMLFLLLYLFGIVVGFLSGYLIGAKQNYLSLIFVLIAPFMFKLFKGKIKTIESERLSFRKGAVGEALTGYILNGLPNSYYVVNDLKAEFGNIDHVVIGPTGVYLLDTKNWAGTITADNNGELLRNGKPTDKPEVKNFTRRVMSTKERIRTLCGLDPYFQGIFVFPSAYVDSKSKKVGYVDCVIGEKLHDYIVGKPNKLSKKDIESISKAFSQLARMDTGFEDKK